MYIYWQTPELWEGFCGVLRSHFFLSTNANRSFKDPSRILPANVVESNNFVSALVCFSAAVALRADGSCPHAVSMALAGSTHAYRPARVFARMRGSLQRTGFHARGYMRTCAWHKVSARALSGSCTPEAVHACTHLWVNACARAARADKYSSRASESAKGAGTSARGRAELRAARSRGASRATCRTSPKAARRHPKDSCTPGG